MNDLPPDHTLRQLFRELRRRDFLLGPDDLLALHRLLSEGFGWASNSALRDLCRALWAKSYDEQVVLDSLFDQLVKEVWSLTPTAGARTTAPTPALAERVHSEGNEAETLEAPLPPGLHPSPHVENAPGRLPAIPSPNALLSTRPFVMVPQHPLAFRAVAQAWRRLRRPVRVGPATELDIAATLSRRAVTGVVTPPVLRPRRRNTARMLLLVDRHGSMTPFDDFVAEVARAIEQAAQLAHTTTFYFHDVPSERTNDAALARLPRDTLSPRIDTVLAELVPARSGWLYRDPDLIEPVALASVLRNYAPSRAAVIISDAGAARGRYDAARVLDSLAFDRALHLAGATSAWLNPLPRSRWSATTAAEIDRHVPMFPLDRDGTHRAVNHLRGQLLSARQPP
jgi:uncharacterized protein